LVVDGSDSDGSGDGSGGGGDGLFWFALVLQIWLGLAGFFASGFLLV